MMKKSLSVLLLAFLLTACSPTPSSEESSVIDLDVVPFDSNEGGETDVNELGDEASEVENILVEMPLSEAVIESPLVVKGQARGPWFFEGSFMVRLLDMDGNELAFDSAVASSDWMTNDFVPFKAELDFELGDLQEGMLVLENDNPSGLPENALQLEIPVRFQ